MRAERPNLRKVLIIRLDRLGDTILATPLITAIREHYPQCEIFFLASPQGAPALAGNTLLDRLIILDSEKATLREKLSLGRLLQQEHFDGVINLSEKLWPHLWTRFTGSPLRIGFFPGASQPVKSLFLPAILSHRIPSPNDPSKPSTMHEVERYMELLRPLGIGDEGKALSVALSGDSIAWADRFLREHARCIAPPFIALHLTTKWALEGWSPDCIIRLSQFILERRPDLSILATYGAAEKEWVKPLLDRLNGERRCVFFGTDFHCWASLISRCTAVITMDTGTVHLAAALGIPVIDIFPTANFDHCSVRWRPWKVPARVIHREAVPTEATEEERRRLEENLQQAILCALDELM